MDEVKARALSAEDGVAEIPSADNLPSLETEVFPGPIAEALYFDDSTLSFIMGPVGSGKTTTAIKSRLRRAMAMPRSVVDGVRYYRLTVIRETYRQLWSTTIPDYLNVFPKKLGTWSGGRGGPVSFHMPFDDGIGPINFQLEFMAFGDAIEESMRGLKTTDIHLHEADTNPKKVLVNAITRIDRYPDKVHFKGYPLHLQAYGQIIGDLNAPEEDNWFAPIVLDPKARDKLVADIQETMPTGAPPFAISVLRQPGYGEPGAENLQNLGPGYYEKQIATQTLLGQGDATERLVYNRISFRRLGDPVFGREFNANVHVAPQEITPDPSLPLLIGLDQGFKGAAVIGQFRPPFHWTILATAFWPKERLMAAEFGRRLNLILDSPRFDKCRVEAAWGDMAGEHGASQAADENASWNQVISKTIGVRVRPQRIGTNRITPRLEAVRAALEFLEGGSPGLLICPTCAPLRAGFSARYIWTDEITTKGDKNKVPDKSIAEANVMDALQYLLLSQSRGDGTTPVSRQHSGDDRRGSSRGGEDARDPSLSSYDVTEPYR